jgi:hypothetical protein
MRLRLLVHHASWCAIRPDPGRDRHHVLDEAGDHRQRRAQFVGDVGDEIAAHRLHPLDLGHVEADQQLAVLPKRITSMEHAALPVGRPVLRDSPSRAPARNSAKRGRRIRLVTSRPMSRSPRRPRCCSATRLHQTMWSSVSRKHQPVGGGLRRLAENLQVGLDAGARLVLLAQQAIELDEDVAPGAPGVGNLALVRRLQPALQAPSWKVCRAASAAGAAAGWPSTGRRAAPNRGRRQPRQPGGPAGEASSADQTRACP